MTRAEAAQIDFALLENPALIALKPDDRFGAILDPNREDGIQAASRLADIAADFRREVAESTKDNVLEGDSGADGGSEWVYRQTMSHREEQPELRQLNLFALPCHGDIAAACAVDGKINGQRLPIW